MCGLLIFILQLNHELSYKCNYISELKSIIIIVKVICIKTLLKNHNLTLENIYSSKVSRVSFCMTSSKILCYIKLNCVS